MEWRGLTIGVLGGDEREQEIVRLAALTGAEVRGYGFPWPTQDIPGVTRAKDAEGVVRGARYLLLPIPGLGGDGSVYAPSASTSIHPTRGLLALLPEGAHVTLGGADDRLREAAASLAIGLTEYEDDRELMHLRAPAIVEGALQLAIEHTRVTIHSAAAGCGRGPRDYRVTSRPNVTGAWSPGSVLPLETRLSARRPMPLVPKHSREPSSRNSLHNLAMLFSTVPALCRWAGGARVLADRRPCRRSTCCPAWER